MSKKIFIIIVILVCFGLISGFSLLNFQDFFKRIVPKEADDFAREYIEILRQRNFEQAKELLNPEIVTPEIDSQLQTVVSFLDQKELVSVEIVDFETGKFWPWSWKEEKPYKRVSLSYQLQFEDKYVLVDVIVDKISGKQLIFGFHLTPLPKPIQEINAFTFSGKSPIHYLLFLVAIIVVIFTLYVLILCIRTPGIKRKWLWCIFTLLGVGTLNLNWITGSIEFTPLSFLFFSIGFARWGLYGPWILSVAFPLGALIFLLKRRKIKKMQSIEEVS